MNLRYRLSLGALIVAPLVGFRADPAGVRTQHQGGSDSAAVASVVTRFHDALSAGDSAAALALLATDAVVLESGSMESRAEYRSHHLPADIEFARTVPSVRGKLSVRVSGATAWTSGTSTSRGEFKGRAINTMSAESMVLTKGANGWRITAIHWSSRTRRPPAS